MKYGLNLFCKEKLDENELVKKLKLDKKNILFINENDDWNKFNDEITTLVEYNGVLESEDHEKYENENLTLLKKDFVKTFRMTEEDFDREIIEFDGSVKDFYIYCEHKFRKYNIPETVKPRRGRPRKNKS